MTEFSAPDPFFCGICDQLPLETVCTPCGHFFCAPCLKAFCRSNRNCPKCSKKRKLGKPKEMPQYENILCKAFPELYTKRKKTGFMTKIQCTDQIGILTENITRLVHARNNLLSKVRNNDIKQQARDKFGVNRDYNIILADPPWHYPNQACNGAIGDKYNQMQDQDIYALPVEGLAKEDCVLLMWTTYPKLQIALNTINAWGFRYSTSFVAWSKFFPKKMELSTAGGSWTRSNTEVCLLGLKGDMSKFRMRNICTPNAILSKPKPNPLFQEEGEEPDYCNSVLLGHHERHEEDYWNRVILTSPLVTNRRAHSVKPEEIYTKIDDVFGDLPRIELFARAARPGWDSFGDQLMPVEYTKTFTKEMDDQWKERQEKNFNFVESFFPELAERWAARTGCDAVFDRDVQLAKEAEKMRKRKRYVKKQNNDKQPVPSAESDSESDDKGSESDSESENEEQDDSDSNQE